MRFKILFLFITILSCSTKDDLEGDYWLCDNNYGYVEISFCSNLMHFYNGEDISPLSYSFDGKEFNYGVASEEDSLNSFSFIVEEYSDSLLIISNSDERLVLNKFENEGVTACTFHGEQEEEKLMFAFFQRKKKFEECDIK